MKKNQLLNILIPVSALIFIFVSSDSNLKYQSDITLLFRKLFYSGFYHPRLFKLIDYIFIFISFSLIKNYGINYNNSKKILKFIWAITIINTILIFINPNHDAEYMFLGLPLLSDVSLYTAIIFTFSLFFVKEDGFIYFIKNFGKYILLFAMVKALFLFYLWLAGKGFYFWGFYSILMEEDNLLLVAFLQLLSFYLYNQSRNNKFFYMWFLLLLIEILSFRRSGLFVSILTITVYLIFLYLTNTPITKKIGFIFASILGLIIILNSIQYLPNIPKLYIGRYVGEFISVPGIPPYLELFRNKHLEQAEYGLEAAVDLLPFWGYGYGHNIGKATIYYLSNTAIHNSYVAVWMFHNLVYTFYLIILAFIVFYNLFKEAFSPKKNNFKVMVGIFLSIFFINYWVLPIANVVEIKMIIFRTLLFALFLRVSDNNLGKILGYR